MSQYTTGTVTVTNASTTVTGSGTSWSGNVTAGSVFTINGSGVPYIVASVGSNTSITLTSAYGGSTASGQSYSVTTSFTSNRKLPYMEQGDVDPATVHKRAMVQLDALLGVGFSANRVIYTDASGNFTNGAELTFDGTNLGLGTTTPAAKLHVAHANGLYAFFINSVDASGEGIGLGSGTNLGRISTNGATTAMSFEINASEKARLDTSGNFLVGTATAKGKITAQGQVAIGQTGSASAAAGIYLYASDTLSDNSFLCRVSNGSGTTTWYIGNQAITTSSDRRLKENINPTKRDALHLLNQWEIIDHTWNDPSDQCENNRNSRGQWTGVVAQQIQPITPWLVNKPLEDTNEDGSINPWTVDFGYAVPLLVKAIQQLVDKHDAMRAEFDAYKAEHP